jgi:dTDP-4-amino-4,6-dideoxygalactose transaminase
VDLLLAKGRKPPRNQYGNMGMSNLSLRLVKRIDYDSVYRQRRDHFKFLSGRICALDGINPIYKSLPDGVCPWGFPILVNNRDKIQKSLSKHGIELPIHWSLPHFIPQDRFPDSKYLTEHILTLPVFQGLGISRLTSLISKLEAAKQA